MLSVVTGPIFQGNEVQALKLLPPSLSHTG